MRRFIHAFATIAFLASALAPAKTSATEYLNEDEAEQAMDEIGKWADKYYLKPEPEKIPEMLELMLRLPMFEPVDEYDEEEAEDIFIDNPEAESRARIAMGFAVILHDNPHHIPPLVEDFGERGWVEQEFIILMLAASDTKEGRNALEKLAKAPEAKQFHNRIERILKAPPFRLDDYEHMGIDTIWMIFSVNGDEKAVLHVIDIIEAEQEAKAQGTEIISGAAWSLSGMAQEHERVRKVIAKEIPRRDEATAAILRKILESKRTREEAQVAQEKKEKPAWEEPAPIRPDTVELGPEFTVEVAGYKPGDQIPLYQDGPGHSSYRYGGEKSLAFRASRDGTCFFRLNGKKRTLIGITTPYGERAARAVLLSLTDQELAYLHDLDFRLREGDRDKILPNLDEEKVHLTILDVCVHKKGLAWASGDSTNAVLPHNRWRYLELWEDQDISYEGLQHLTALQELVIVNCEQNSDISFLAPLTSLRKLGVSGATFLTDLSALSGLTQLRQLDVSECYNLRKLGPLKNLRQLEWLNLANCFRLRDVRPLANLKSLQYLNLERCESLKNIEPIQGLTRLEYLNILGCEHVKSIAVVKDMKELRTLLMDETRVEGLAPIANHKKLENLGMGWCPAPQDGAVFEKLLRRNRFKVLTLPAMTTDTDLSIVCETQPQLGELDVWGCQQLTDIAPLANLKSLHQLRFGSCPKVTDLGAIGQLVQLRYLDIQIASPVIDVTPLQNLTNLKRLQVMPPLSPEQYRQLTEWFPKSVFSN